MTLVYQLFPFLNISHLSFCRAELKAWEDKMMTEGKEHLVRKNRFLTKNNEERKPGSKQKIEQESACSQSKPSDLHFNQIDCSSHTEPDSIQIDSEQTQQDTRKKTTKNEQKTTTSPKASPETGIFDKISRIWTNGNENTASDTSQKNQKQIDLVKNFKKFFKSQKYTIFHNHHRHLFLFLMKTNHLF